MTWREAQALGDPGVSENGKIWEVYTSWPLFTVLWGYVLLASGWGTLIIKMVSYEPLKKKTKTSAVLDSPSKDVNSRSSISSPFDLAKKCFSTLSLT